MNYKDLVVVTQSDAAVYIMYNISAGNVRTRGLIPLDSLLTLSVQTDMETRPVLQLGVPYQVGYTTGSVVQAGQMTFPGTVESPFQKYIDIVKKQEEAAGQPLRNRYLKGPSEWFGEEFMPSFSLLIVYVPEVTQSQSNLVDVSYVHVPGVKITQRSEEQTPDGLTVLVYRFQQLGMFRYKQQVSVIGKKIDLDVTNLVQFKPYGDYTDMNAQIMKVLKSG